MPPMPPGGPLPEWNDMNVVKFLLVQLMVVIMEILRHVRELNGGIDPLAWPAPVAPVPAAPEEPAPPEPPAPPQPAGPDPRDRSRSQPPRPANIRGFDRWQEAMKLARKDFERWGEDPRGKVKARAREILGQWNNAKDEPGSAPEPVD